MIFDRKKGEIGAAHSHIVNNQTPVTLLGGGPVLAEDLKTCLALAPLLVAADGGADHAKAAGVVPEAVIGDLDSFKHGAHAHIPPDRIHHIAEQDSTDFDKALRSIHAPLVLALGFVGARIDHELAAYHTLITQGAQRCILFGPEDIVVHVPSGIDLDLTSGARVSLFPFAPVTASIQGLRWSFETLDLAPMTRIGTSNEALGGPVRLRFSGSGTLLILPRDQLSALLSAQWDPE